MSASRLSRAFLAFSVATIALAASPPASSGTGDGALIRLPDPRPSKGPGVARFDPGTVLVRFRPGTADGEARGLIAARGAIIGRAVPRTGFVRVRTGSSTAEALVSQLRGDPRVAEASLNHIRSASAVPNDPLYKQYQAYLRNIRMESAWGVTTGSTSYKVAIVDTGVDLNHPDLAGRMQPGRDVVHNDAYAWDDNGHGTMVAGIAAAITNNSKGVAGVAWRGSIIPVKVLNSQGSGTDADVAEGVTWAADHGAKVINLSLGGTQDTTVLKAAIEYAISKNIVVVAAAGNDGFTTPSYPAAYPDVMAVSATDNVGNFVWFSNYGWWVDISAPGINITSTYPASGTGQAYAYGSGTSFSAPIVSGVALLARYKYPSLTQAQIQNKLRSTARDFGPRGIDPFHGWGRVDGYAALGGARAAPGPTATRDALEPNGVLDQARALVSSVSSSISPEGDVDWFFTDVTATGSLKFTVTPPPINENVLRPFEMDPAIEVYGPGLTSLGEMDTYPLGEKESITVPVDAPGRYYLKVTNFHGSRTPSPYSASVTFSSTAVPPVTGELIWVRDAAPADFASGVARTVTPTVELGRDADPASVTSATAYMMNGVFGTRTAINVTYDVATRTISIDPVPTLGANTPYLVFVTGLQDATGDPMTGAFSYRFVTGG